MESDASETNTVGRLNAIRKMGKMHWIFFGVWPETRLKQRPIKWMQQEEKKLRRRSNDDVAVVAISFFFSFFFCSFDMCNFHE